MNNPDLPAKIQEKYRTAHQKGEAMLALEAAMQRKAAKAKRK
jgi:hypothetical protein